jgi:hypothetical protein
MFIYFNRIKLCCMIFLDDDIDNIRLDTMEFIKRVNNHTHMFRYMSQKIMTLYDTFQLKEIGQQTASMGQLT